MISPHRRFFGVRWVDVARRPLAGTGLPRRLLLGRHRLSGLLLGRVGRWVGRLRRLVGRLAAARTCVAGKVGRYAGALVGGCVAAVVGRTWVTGAAEATSVTATPAVATAAASATPRSGAGSGDGWSVLAADRFGLRCGGHRLELLAARHRVVSAAGGSSGELGGGLAGGLRRLGVGGQRLLRPLLVLGLDDRCWSGHRGHRRAGRRCGRTRDRPASAEEQHRRGPLRGVLGDEGLAGAGGGLVDGEPVGERAVELAGERRSPHRRRWGTASRRRPCSPAGPVPAPCR